MRINPLRKRKKKFSTTETINFVQIYLYVGNGKWEDFHLQHLVPLLKEWKITELTACTGNLISANNSRSFIIKDICMCNFPYVTNVDLGGNNIESIEQLSHISFLRMKDFWINTQFNGDVSNYIINI